MATDATLSDKRDEALQVAFAKIDKKLGKGNISIIGDTVQESIEVIPSGSLEIDIALGRGGVPRGRIIEIWGPESSGKTLFCIHQMAEYQKRGLNVAFIDAEHAFDMEWAGKIGVNTDRLIFSQPDSGEDAFEIVDTLVNSGAVDLIVVDSVAALVPQKELEGDFGDAQMGSQARMMSQGLRKIAGAAKRNNVTVIFINQTRDKIGVFFGSPTTTTGGNALKYYASIRLEIAGIGTLKEGGEEVGRRTRIKVKKNKVAAPFKVAEFDILWIPGFEGYSKEGDLRDLGLKLGLIKKAGSWFSLGQDLGDYKAGSQLGQGEGKVRLFLKENPELAELIEARIREEYLGGKASLKELDPSERNED